MLPTAPPVDLVTNLATPPPPVTSGTRRQRFVQASLQLATVAITSVVMVAMFAVPANAASIGWGGFQRQVTVTFNLAETRRIGDASNVGFGAFIAAVCSTLPGSGARARIIKAGCAVIAVTSYGKLRPMFGRARGAQRVGLKACAQLSYPIGIPSPNPEPFSRIVWAYQSGVRSAPLSGACY